MVLPTIVIGVPQCRVLEQDPLGELVGDARAAADAVEREDELAEAPQGRVDQLWVLWVTIQSTFVMQGANQGANEGKAWGQLQF